MRPPHPAAVSLRCPSSHERPDPLSCRMPRFDCILRGNFTAQTKPRFQDKAGLLFRLRTLLAGCLGSLSDTCHEHRYVTPCWFVMFRHELSPLGPLYWRGLLFAAHQAAQTLRASARGMTPTGPPWPTVRHNSEGVHQQVERTHPQRSGCYIDCDPPSTATAGGSKNVSKVSCAERQPRGRLPTLPAKEMASPANATKPRRRLSGSRGFKTAPMGKHHLPPDTPCASPDARILLR